MFFSIIVPVYNVEKYLKECIESILFQTYKDYEVILVNDGSTDSSGSICDYYAELYKNIKVIHKKNGGQSSARNIGIATANGEYLIFIDSDDYIVSNDFLCVLKSKLKNQDFILYKHQKFNDGNAEFENCKYTFSIINENDSYVTAIGKLIYNDAFYGMAWVKAVNKQFLIDNQIFFDESLVCEDMDWNYNLVTNASSLTFVDKAFVAYRQRENSVTSSVKLKTLTDFILFLERWSEKIKQIDSKEFQCVLYSSMAKYYSNLLITYNRVKEKSKKQYIKRIKSLSWLLNYSMSKRPRLVSKMYKIFGFRLTVKVLKMIDKR